MKKEDLIKFLNSHSSPKEKKEFYAWLNRPCSEKTLEEILQNNWEKAPTTVLGDEGLHKKLLERIHHTTAAKKKRIFVHEKWGNWTRTAATYLLLFFSAYLLSQMGGSKEAVTQGIKTIEKTAEAGEKIKVTLPDRSIVLLNSLSKITFSSDFGQTRREVDLEGEAYFEIAPDPHQPFRVKTQWITTTALGTAFNAFSKNGEIVISLTEGKVRVSHPYNTVELVPGEMAVLEDKSNNLERKYFDPDVTLAWKEGIISFKSKELKAILDDLEDWYGVQFNAEAIDLHRKVTGEFGNNNLEDILQGLSFSLNFKYNIDENSITINS